MHLQASSSSLWGPLASSWCSSMCIQAFIGFLLGLLASSHCISMHSGHHFHHLVSSGLSPFLVHSLWIIQAHSISFQAFTTLIWVHCEITNSFYWQFIVLFNPLQCPQQHISLQHQSSCHSEPLECALHLPPLPLGPPESSVHPASLFIALFLLHIHFFYSPPELLQFPCSI